MFPASLAARFSRYYDPLALKELEEATTYQQCWAIYRNTPKGQATEKVIEKLLDILEQAVNDATTSGELDQIRHFALPCPGDIQGWSLKDLTPFASMIVSRIDAIIETIITKMKVLEDEERMKALSSDDFWEKLRVFARLYSPHRPRYDTKPIVELFENTLEAADTPEKCWFLYSVTCDGGLIERITQKLDALLKDKGF